jgi:hypothetical protein
MGLAVRRKRSQYWYDFDNLKRALFAYTQEHGEAGVMPTQKDLEKAEKGAELYLFNVSRRHRRTTMPQQPGNLRQTIPLLVQIRRKRPPKTVG